MKLWNDDQFLVPGELAMRMQHPNQGYTAMYATPYRAKQAQRLHVDKLSGGEHALVLARVTIDEVTSILILSPRGTFGWSIAHLLKRLRKQ